MDDENIFAEDDAIDYMIYEKITRDRKAPQDNNGCLGSLFILFTPIAAFIAKIIFHKL